MIISIHVHLLFNKKTKIKDSITVLCIVCFNLSLHLHCRVSWRLLHSIQGKWKAQRKSKLWFILAVPTNYNKWQRFKHIEKFIVLKHYRDEMREDNWRLMFRSSIVVPLVLMRMAVRLMLWARGFLLLGFSVSTSSWESHSSTSPSLQAMLCSWLLPV